MVDQKNLKKNKSNKRISKSRKLPNPEVKDRTEVQETPKKLDNTLEMQNYLPPPAASASGHMAFIRPRRIKRDGQKFIVRKGRVKLPNGDGYDTHGEKVVDTYIDFVNAVDYERYPLDYLYLTLPFVMKSIDNAWYNQHSPETYDPKVGSHIRRIENGVEQEFYSQTVPKNIFIDGYYSKLMHINLRNWGSSKRSTRKLSESEAIAYVDGMRRKFLSNLYVYKGTETVGSASYDFRTPAISTVNFGRYPYSHPNLLLYQVINLDAKCELHEAVYRKDMFALVHHCAIAARATRKYDLAMALYEQVYIFMCLFNGRFTHQVQFEIISTFIEAHDDPGYTLNLGTAPVIYDAVKTLLAYCDHIPAVIQCCNRLFAYSNISYKFNAIIDSRFADTGINACAALLRAGYFASRGHVEKSRGIVESFLEENKNNPDRMTGTSEAFITFTLATYTLLSVSRSNPDDKLNPKKIAFAFAMFEKYGRLKRIAAGKCNMDDRYVLQEIWYNIGCAYHELGMVDMAKSCYIRSIMARESSVRIKS